MPRRWPIAQPVLSDQSVVLRGWMPADAQDVFRACQDPEIQHFTLVRYFTTFERHRPMA